MAIGLQAKKIPVQKVEGTNLLTIDTDGLAAWVKQTVPQEAYSVIAAAPAVMKKLGSPQRSLPARQGALIRYIASNAASMRKTSQPVPGAGPRDFMPQTGGIDWQEPLQKGQIDVKPPFAKPAE